MKFEETSSSLQNILFLAAYRVELTSNKEIIMAKLKKNYKTVELIDKKIKKLIASKDIIVREPVYMTETDKPGLVPSIKEDIKIYRDASQHAREVPTTGDDVESEFSSFDEPIKRTALALEKREWKKRGVKNTSAPVEDFLNNREGATGEKEDLK